ncbi:MAG: tetratricopeptide repeat protein [Dehalococcoidales bacterium]|nr:tetratricopeptide repeat protein [Dehalococcoidales bacterium]
MMEEAATGLRQRRARQAIGLAMEGRWREAVAVNQSLVTGYPDDVSAYNRLGRAYLEIGEFSNAYEAYTRAIELDPYNTIAQKNLSRLSRLREVIAGAPEDSRVEPLHFIEETGKAGIVDLHQLGLPEVVAKMVAGDKVYLKVEGPNLKVETGRSEYLGQVEPKHTQRLIRLMAGGNEYSAAVVSSTEETASIIIREVYQHPSQAGRLSFPAREFKSPRPYLSDRVIKHEHDLEYEEEEGVVEGEEEETDYAVAGVKERELSGEVATGEGDDITDSDEE